LPNNINVKNNVLVQLSWSKITKAWLTPQEF